MMSATVHPTDKISPWENTTSVPEYPELLQDVSTDVCVIGGGLAGLSAAYFLAREGKKVVVLEDGAIGGGMTHVTSAHLTSVLDERYYRLEQLHGADGARLASESHRAAINAIEKISRDEGIDCDFERVPGFLYRAPSSPEDEIEREHNATARLHIEALPRAAAPLPFDTGPCLEFLHQGQFHPLKYLKGLAEAIERRGGSIYGHTHALKIDNGSPPRVTTPHATVTAAAVIVATNAPVNDRVAIHLKQAAYTTYVIGARIPKGSVAHGLYWDTADPYHYVRVQELHDEAMGEIDLLIVGGEDHRTGQERDTAQRFSCLEQWTRKHFPMVGEVEFEWSGEVMQSVDGLAYIGRNPMDSEHVYVVTGDSGLGITHGTIAGLLLTDLINGRENAWAKLYAPNRVTLRAAGTAAKELLNTAYQYADWFSKGDLDLLDEIEPGKGATLRRGLSKVAVYRDEAGELYAYSAVCPHLSGIVHWNDTDKTWDCPCHGSRFSKDGAPIVGPANSGLKPVPVPEEPRSAHDEGMMP